MLTLAKLFDQPVEHRQPRHQPRKRRPAGLTPADAERMAAISRRFGL
jgi:hypothetical protein